MERHFKSLDGKKRYFINNAQTYVERKKLKNAHVYRGTKRKVIDKEISDRIKVLVN